MKHRAWVFFAAAFVGLSPTILWAGSQKRPMIVDDLLRFQRVSDPQISPDGKGVAYVVGTVDRAANKTASSIWLAPQGSGLHAHYISTLHVAICVRRVFCGDSHS